MVRVMPCMLSRPTLSSMPWISCASGPKQATGVPPYSDEVAAVGQAGGGIVAERAAGRFGMGAAGELDDLRFGVEGAGVGHEALELQLHLGAAEALVARRLGHDPLDVGLGLRARCGRA